jgi:hypothetical protein
MGMKIPLEMFHVYQQHNAMLKMNVKILQTILLGSNKKK